VNEIPSKIINVHNNKNIKIKKNKSKDKINEQKSKELQYKLRDPYPNQKHQCVQSLTSWSS
jgi:hypothetical protein